MISSHRTLAVVIALALIAAPVIAADRPLTALAPFETYADGFGDVRGVAVDDAGNVLVADRGAGTIVRIATDRTPRVVARGLERPVGLAFDPGGRLLVAEERAARVVRLEPGGARTRLVTGIKQPRWLAVRDDGTVFIGARRLTRGADPEPDDESAEPEMVLALSPAGALRVFVDGLRGVQGLAVNHDTLFVATQGRRPDARTGEVFGIPILADGTAGPPVPVAPAADFKKPIGVARDRLGALYVTAKELTVSRDRSKHAIAKLHGGARVSLFAEHLARPQGLDVDAAGNLFVADGHRVVKFSAPAPPTLTAPTVSRMPTVGVTGNTEPRARIDLLVNDAGAAATIVADGAGHFTLSVALTENTTNTLEASATAHRGDGLTSAPARANVVHDAIPPMLAFQAPPANAHVRQTVSVQATASDAARVASITLSVDGDPLAAALGPSPSAPSVTAAATWNTLTVPDGAHTLAAAATDEAGNAATTSRIVIVDNTPPDTEITGGPSGPMTGASATFGFTGSDNLTPAPNLEFAWRLNGGAFSAFSPATSVTVANLGAGPHTFEVTARDRAGNEDPNPARRDFSVGTLSVTITEPASGATVSEGLVIVRGTVTADGEVSVIVSGGPALIQGTTYSALASVSSGAPTITAVATTATGEKASATMSLNIQPPDPHAPVLRVSPAIGPAPLAVRFSVLRGPTPLMVELDIDGNGTVDFTGPALDDRVFTYPTAGPYLARVTITDNTGLRHVATAGVMVLDGAVLDALFQARWRGLKDALRRSAIEEALTHMTFGKRDDYRDVFSALAARLPAVDQILTDIRPVEQVGIWAEYEMLKMEEGEVVSYFILFEMDEDGIWRLRFL